MNKKLHCAKCLQPIEGYPATSRRDNKTKICPLCGIKEALEDLKTPGSITLEKAQEIARRAISDAVLPLEEFNELLNENAEYAKEYINAKPRTGFEPIIIAYGASKTNGKRLTETVTLDNEEWDKLGKQQAFFNAGVRFWKKDRPFALSAIFNMNEAWARDPETNAILEEILIVSGMRIDNKQNQAMFTINRDREQIITLSKERFIYADNEQEIGIISNLLIKFYQGWFSKSQGKEAGI
jgi:hypothetical protein